MGRKLGRHSWCVSGLPEEDALLEFRWVSRECSEMLCLQFCFVSPPPFLLLVSGVEVVFFLPVLNSSLVSAELLPLVRLDA